MARTSRSCRSDSHLKAAIVSYANYLATFFYQRVKFNSAFPSCVLRDRMIKRRTGIANGIPFFCITRKLFALRCWASPRRRNAVVVRHKHDARINPSVLTSVCFLFCFFISFYRRDEKIDSLEIMTLSTTFARP